MVKICKYKQVEAYLRHAIEQRLFNSHEKLPSIRELALALSVSKIPSFEPIRCWKLKDRYTLNQEVVTVFRHHRHR